MSRVLVVNAGSSSLKLRVLDADDAVAFAADLPAPRGTIEPGSLGAALGGAGPIDAVGHRVVHGGTTYLGPVRIDHEVVRRLEAMVDLAPLHQPKSLGALRAVSEILPDVPAVACFDTAFHATMPPAATTYALPPEWRRRWDLRRFGFHGLSHAYAARRATEMVGRPATELRIVSCHLGAGASVTAIAGGRSIDTTMGFTPLEGLVMATRSGSVDPGLVLWLAEHVGMPPSELAATLEHRSGLLGLAGTPDMRKVLERADGGDATAILARDVYLHRLVGAVASMTAAMGGLDVLLFTGGVGENSPEIRRRAADRVAHLGVRLDQAANAAAGPDAAIGADGSAVHVFVIRAREDLQIAHEVRSVLA
jgi:acetate kinase